MAGIYSPTITVSPTPLLEVASTDATPYEEIQETQGNIVYEAESLYFQAQTIEQINTPLEVQKYDANGNLKSTKKIDLADVNQVQPVRNLDLKKEPIIFDGRTRFNIELQPNETVKLYFKTKQIESSDLLNGGNNIFENHFLKTYGFFDDYDDEIKDSVDNIKNQID